MGKPKQLVDLLRDALELGGYDGLYNPGECSCLLQYGLAPCSGVTDDCTAGYRIEGCSDECGLGCDWHVGLDKRDSEAGGCENVRDWSVETGDPLPPLPEEDER